jgi:hypothetical protein
VSLHILAANLGRAAIRTLLDTGRSARRLPGPPLEGQAAPLTQRGLVVSPASVASSWVEVAEDAWAYLPWETLMLLGSGRQFESPAGRPLPSGFAPVPREALRTSIEATWQGQRKPAIYQGRSVPH